MLVVAAILACHLFCRVPIVSSEQRSCDTSRLYIAAEEVKWAPLPLLKLVALCFYIKGISFVMISAGVVGLCGIRRTKSMQRRPHRY